MQYIRFQNIPKSFKLFISLMLCIIGLNYLAFLGGIWIDTEMKVANIMEAYSDFEAMELTEHSFRYLFWFTGTFSIITLLFLLTSYSEKLKRSFAMVVPIFIVLDIGSMWLIQYNVLFSYLTYISGLVLAGSFLMMFFCIQYDLWFTQLDIKE